MADVLSFVRSSRTSYKDRLALAPGGCLFKVRRITARQNSSVWLSESIGVGSTEKEVLKSFPGFRDEPHKYLASPAEYLTASNAVSGHSVLRFGIGADGKVSVIHVGMMPVIPPRSNDYISSFIGITLGGSFAGSFGGILSGLSIFIWSSPILPFPIPASA